MGLQQINFKPSLHIIILTLLCMVFANSASASQKILVWGDSLSSAYGIPVDKGWVNLMRRELGNGVEIINGSISGETTRGGLTRLPMALKTHKPDYVLLELGASDGLRGLPPRVTKNNLQKMIEKIHKADAEAILLGMKIPPNYGVAYTQQFESLFVELARENKLLFVPFFLKDVIEKLELLQEDELHPTAEAQPLILKQVLPILTHALQKFENKKTRLN